MTTFTNNDVASRNIIYASDHNTQGALLAAVLNGGLQADNLHDDAVTTLKIADSAVTTAKIAAGAVTPEKRSGGFKIGVIPGATLGSTGNKAITGVGFTPKLVRFIVAPGTASTTSAIDGTGAMDGTTQYAVATYVVDGTGQRKLSSTSSCILWTNATTSQLVASYVSLDSDGFTINVTTASSGFDVIYEAYA